MRSSAFCLPPASSGLVQSAFSFPPAALAVGFLRCWCVCLIVGNEMPCHVSFGVVCGQRTVAACCEMKMGLEWGSVMNSGSRCTRNAVAPPFGTSILRPGFRAQKAAANLGPCAPYPTVRYRARGPDSGPGTGPKIRSSKSRRPVAPPAGIKCVLRE